LLEGIENGRKIDFEKEILGKYIALREARCHRTTEYIKDMGTPERLSQAERDIESGIVEGRRRSNKQRAIFLDRDGTINKYVGLLYKPEMFELLSGAAAAIRRINRSPYLCFVVSNQPVVARNLCDMATVGNIHRKMETELGKEHAFLDDIVFCPHHPDRGFPGENAEYKVQCDCRKPKPGMLLDIAKRYNVELKSSFLIGDTTGDIQTAKNAGVKSILVETGEGGRDGKYEARPDHAAPDLGHAVEWILNREGINA
jgi:histidinol-phosphate phosphatase family protein